MLGMASQYAVSRSMPGEVVGGPHGPLDWRANEGWIRALVAHAPRGTKRPDNGGRFPPSASHSV